MEIVLPSSVPTFSTPLKVYIVLPRDEVAREWNRRIETISAFQTAETKIVSSLEEADCILRPDAPALKGNPIFSHFNPKLSPLPSQLVWDSGDFPTGRWPGLYCALPKNLFDPARHRSFCYPNAFNECVQHFDPADARYEIGFVGGITSGLRARIVRALQQENRSDILVKIQSGPWGRMFDRSGVPVKLEYAELLRRSRFFLCPRGNGVGSIRLFETLQAGRVPVIISDAYVLPEGIDWESCSVRIAEKDIDQLPALIACHHERWQILAMNARKVWEDHFSDRSLLGEIGRHLRELLPAARSVSLGSKLRYVRGISASLAGIAVRSASIQAHNLLSRVRSRS